MTTAQACAPAIREAAPDHNANAEERSSLRLAEISFSWVSSSLRISAIPLCSLLLCVGVSSNPTPCRQEAYPRAQSAPNRVPPLADRCPARRRSLPAASRTAAAYNGAAVDHADGPSASFFVSASAVGTSLDMKVQFSNDGSAWTDDDGASGNDTAITQLTAAGTAQLNVPNPRGRYSRVVATAVGTCVFGVTSVLGPLRHVAA